MKNHKTRTKARKHRIDCHNNYVTISTIARLLPFSNLGSMHNAMGVLNDLAQSNKLPFFREIGGKDEQ